jgi:hypothetical protein
MDDSVCHSWGSVARWRGYVVVSITTGDFVMNNLTLQHNATPHLDAVCTVLTAMLAPTERWTLRGWAEHMRTMRHENHAANSWAKHRHEFGAIRELAHALVVARCMDFEVEADAVSPLLEARIAARETRHAANEQTCFSSCA